MQIFKTTIAIILASLLILASAGFARGSHRHYGEKEFHRHEGGMCIFDDIIIDIEDGSVLITNDYEDDEIEITEKYELHINGKLIETSPDQQKLLEQYHTLVMDIDDYANKIGKEGAKMGIEGTAVGILATASAMEALFGNDDHNRYDHDLERATERLEAKAEILEKKAAKIDDMADDLKDLFYDMEDEIPAIAKLNW